MNTETWQAILTLLLFVGVLLTAYGFAFVPQLKSGWFFPDLQHEDERPEDRHKGIGREVSMSLSEEKQRQALPRHLRAAGAKGCAVCGSWELKAGVVHTIATDAEVEGEKTKLKGMRVAPVVCAECGHVMLFQPHRLPRQRRLAGRRVWLDRTRERRGEAEARVRRLGAGREGAIICRDLDNGLRHEEEKAIALPEQGLDPGSAN